MKEIEIDDPSVLPVGSLVTGQILRVEESLKAALVDFGAERYGFAPFNETNLKSIKEGQAVIVRIDEKEFGSKGAVVSVVSVDDPSVTVYRVKRSLASTSLLGTLKLTIVFALVGIGLYAVIDK